MPASSAESDVALFTNPWDSPPNYEYITDPAGVARVVAEMESETIVGYDLETTGLDPFVDDVVLMQIGNHIKQFVIDVRKVSVEPLRGILENTKITKLGHNIKFDYRFTAVKLGIYMENLADTMIAEQLLYAGLVRTKEGGEKDVPGLEKMKLYMGFGLHKKTGVPGVVPRYTGVQLDKTLQESFILTNLQTVFTEEQLAYAANDVRYVFPVWSAQMDKFNSGKYSAKRILEIEMAAIPPTADMELNGWLMDTEQWMTNINAYHKQAIAVGQELIDLMGKKKVNVQMSLLGEEDEDVDQDFTALQSSPQIMKHFVKLGIQIEGTAAPALQFWQKQTTKQIKAITEDPDADPQEVKRLETQMDFVKKLLLYRNKSKLVQTYGEKLIAKIHPATGRLHGRLEAMGTTTGRYSSEDPNLQNFPKEAFVRNSFIAGKGLVLVTCDFSQIELRIVAQLSQDDLVIDAFNAGKDLHSVTASSMFNIPYELFEQKPLPKELAKKRGAAKSIVFGLAYGRGAKSLSEQIDVSEEEAQKMMDDYFRTLPKVKVWLDKAGSEAQANFFAVTVLGRKRFFIRPDDSFRVNNPDDYRKHLGSIKRQGMNHPIQGCNADIVKLALPRLRTALRAVEGRLISTVHDEMVVEAPIERAAEVAHILVELMEGTAAEVLHAVGERKVNTKSECNIGNTWLKERAPCVVVNDKGGIEFGIHHHMIQAVKKAKDGTAIIELVAGDREERPQVATSTPYEKALNGEEGLETVRKACTTCTKAAA